MGGQRRPPNITVGPCSAHVCFKAGGARIPAPKPPTLSEIVSTFVKLSVELDFAGFFSADMRATRASVAMGRTNSLMPTRATWKSAGSTAGSSSCPWCWSPGFVLTFQSSRDSFLGVARGSREATPPAPSPRWSATHPRRWTGGRPNSGRWVAIGAAGSGVSSDGKLIPSIYNLFIRDPADYLVEIQAFLDPAWPSPPAFAPASDGAALVAMYPTEAVSQLRLGAVTPSQLDAFVEQHQVEAAVSAVPILCGGRGPRPAGRGGSPVALFGLPVVIGPLRCEVQGRPPPPPPV